MSLLIGEHTCVTGSHECSNLAAGDDRPMISINDRGGCLCLFPPNPNPVGCFEPMFRSAPL